MKLIILFVVSIYFGEIESQSLSERLNACSDPFDQFAACTSNSAEADLCDGTRLEFYAYGGVLACYTNNGCKKPVARFGDDVTYKGDCQNGITNALDSNMTACLTQTFQSLASLFNSTDQLKLQSMLTKTANKALAMKYRIGGWNGYERPTYLNATTIAAACDTVTKREAVDKCTRAVYDKTEVAFNNFCNAHATCYKNLGLCGQLYDLFEMLICGCQSYVYLKADVMANDSPSCANLPQYVVDWIPRTHPWCDTSPLKWCQNFGAWWAKGT